MAIQLALAGAILWVQLRGANVCASLAKLATVVLLIMCAVGLAVCFTHFDPAVYASDGGLDFDFAGSASLLSLLVFSVAGWETVSKAAADASGPAARKAGAALITWPVPGDGHPLLGVHRCGRVYALAGGGGPHRPLRRRAGVHHRRARRAGCSSWPPPLWARWG